MSTGKDAISREGTFAHLSARFNSWLGELKQGAKSGDATDPDAAPALAMEVLPEGLPLQETPSDLQDSTHIKAISNSLDHYVESFEQVLSQANTWTQKAYQELKSFSIRQQESLKNIDGQFQRAKIFFTQAMQRRGRFRRVFHIKAKEAIARAHAMIEQSPSAQKVQLHMRLQLAWAQLYREQGLYAQEVKELKELLMYRWDADTGKKLILDKGSEEIVKAAEFLLVQANYNDHLSQFGGSFAAQEEGHEAVDSICEDQPDSDSCLMARALRVRALVARQDAGPEEIEWAAAEAQSLVEDHPSHPIAKSLREDFFSGAPTMDQDNWLAAAKTVVAAASGSTEKDFSTLAKESLVGATAGLAFAFSFARTRNHHLSTQMARQTMVLGATFGWLGGTAHRLRQRSDVIALAFKGFDVISPQQNRDNAARLLSIPVTVGMLHFSANLFQKGAALFFGEEFARHTAVQVTLSSLSSASASMASDIALGIIAGNKKPLKNIQPGKAGFFAVFGGLATFLRSLPIWSRLLENPQLAGDRLSALEGHVPGRPILMGNPHVDLGIRALLGGTESFLALATEAVLGTSAPKYAQIAPQVEDGASLADTLAARFYFRIWGKLPTYFGRLRQALRPPLLRQKPGFQVPPAEGGEPVKSPRSLPAKPQDLPKVIIDDPSIIGWLGAYLMRAQPRDILYPSASQVLVHSMGLLEAGSLQQAYAALEKPQDPLERLKLLAELRRALDDVVNAEERLRIRQGTFSPEDRRVARQEVFQKTLDWAAEHSGSIRSLGALVSRLRQDYKRAARNHIRTSLNYMLRNYDIDSLVSIDNLLGLQTWQEPILESSAALLNFFQQIVNLQKQIHELGKLAGNPYDVEALREPRALCLQYVFGLLSPKEIRKKDWPQPIAPINSMDDVLKNMQTLRALLKASGFEIFKSKDREQKEKEHLIFHFLEKYLRLNLDENSLEYMRLLQYLGEQAQRFSLAELQHEIIEKLSKTIYEVFLRHQKMLRKIRLFLLTIKSRPRRSSKTS